MAAPTTAPPEVRTLADVLRRLGDIPLERIRFRPAPGTATETDVLAEGAKDGFFCELVDGMLVEKAAGIRESLLASLLISLLNQFVRSMNLGIVTGEQGMLRLFPGLIRAPDVAYIAWASIPSGRIPEEPIPHLVPDLAVEILSKSNTVREMKRKREEYFDAKVKLVWSVNPRNRTVRVYSTVDDYTELQETNTLTGGTVLPGFNLLLKDLFGELDRTAPAKA
jgi:Uma2 family endonuclease